MKGHLIVPGGGAFRPAKVDIFYIMDSLQANADSIIKSLMQYSGFFSEAANKLAYPKFFGSILKKKQT
jgi:hypothetical protein